MRGWSVLGLIVALLMVACQGADEAFEKPPTAVPPPSLSAEAFDIGGTPTDVFIMDDRLYATDVSGARLVEVSPDGSLTPVFDFDESPDLVAASEGRVIAWNRASGTLSVYSLGGIIDRTVSVPQDLVSLDVWAGSAWGTVDPGTQLVRIHLASGEVDVIEPLSGAGQPAVLGTRLWVPIELETRIIGFDSSGNRQEDFSAFDGPSNAYLNQDSPGPTVIFEGEGKLWVGYRDSSSVVEFTAGGAITNTLGVTVRPDYLAVTGKGLTVASPTSAIVEFVDFGSLQRSTVQLDGPPADLVVSGEDFWLAVPSTGQVVRLSPG